MVSPDTLMISNLGTGNVSIFHLRLNSEVWTLKTFKIFMLNEPKNKDMILFF